MMSMITDAQMEALKAQLKKYGIESEELRDELADHYAEEMEERMQSGLSAEDAFETFKRHNSWLKLRKLQYKYWEQGASKVHQVIKALVYSVFFGPLSLAAYPLLIFIWWLFSHDVSTWKGYLLGYHALIGSVLVAMAIYILVAKKMRNQYFRHVFNLALFGTYLVVYAPMINDAYFDFTFMEEGKLWPRLLLTVLYFSSVVCAYIAIRLFAWARHRNAPGKFQQQKR